MMAKETWFTPQEAIDAGLADEIAPAMPPSLPKRCRGARALGHERVRRRAETGGAAKPIRKGRGSGRGRRRSNGRRNAAAAESERRSASRCALLVRLLPKRAARKTEKRRGDSVAAPFTMKKE
jgi:hypothetical protein